MRILGVLLLAVGMTASVNAATRYLTGEGIPTTETPGGESMLGTLDWGSPSDITSLEYSVKWGEDDWSGTFSLLATNVVGSSAQIIYGDPSNDLVLSAISADGPFELDADKFVDTAGYGGFEAWTLTNTQPDLNKYGTITSISAVPEPGVKAAAVAGGLCLLVFRRKFLGRLANNAMA